MKQQKCKSKANRPLYSRIFLLLSVMALCLTLTACFTEKIVWEDIILGNTLPTPPATNGEIHTNNKDSLWVDINSVSDKQYADYVEACKEKGFNIDEDSASSSFCAFNDEGYKLRLSHYSSNKEMSIYLDAPMEMAAIVWPSGEAGKKLPVPQSTVGKFSYEYEDRFFVYAGNTTKADYTEYVNKCSDAGFAVDYKKGDDYYYADNEEGWHVDIRYEGNSIMSISIKAPEKAKDTTASSSQVTDKQPTSAESSSSADITILDPDFKAAMDSYEEFMDEYVAFMKKYKANPADMNLLADYADYMSKYADFVKAFEKWEDEELNAAETAYYAAVQARVSKKLLQATS